MQKEYCHNYNIILLIELIILLIAIINLYGNSEVIV